MKLTYASSLKSALHLHFLSIGRYLWGYFAPIGTLTIPTRLFPSWQCHVPYLQTQEIPSQNGLSQQISKKYLSLSVDILQGVAAPRAWLLPFASPLTAKSIR